MFLCLVRIRILSFSLSCSFVTKSCHCLKLFCTKSKVRLECWTKTMPHSPQKACLSAYEFKNHKCEYKTSKVFFPLISLDEFLSGFTVFHLRTNLTFSTCNWSLAQIYFDTFHRRHLIKYSRRLKNKNVTT